MVSNDLSARKSLILIRSWFHVQTVPHFGLELGESA